MKKVFCLFAVLAIVANFSFGQIIVPGDGITVSNTEIANMVEKAKPINKFAGIRDLNRIWPGQIVWVPVEVRPGDTYWWICRDVAFPPYYSEQQPQVSPENPKDQPNPKEGSKFLNFLQSFPWWVWLIVVLIIGAIIMSAYNETKQQKDKGDYKFSDDPTKEGPAFVENGVHTEEEASRHFIDLTRRNHPDVDLSGILIKERKRVYVSTPNGESANVKFANETTQELAFRNVPGWQAMVSIDGGKSFKREVFFQDCGNPVYNRTSMSDKGLIITDTPINFGSEAMDQATKTDIVDVVLEKAQKAEEKRQENEEVVKIQTNESTKIISDCLSLVSNTFLEKQHAHEVVIEFFNPENGIQVAKATLKTKNTNEPKKDEAK